MVGPFTCCWTDFWYPAFRKQGICCQIPTQSNTKSKSIWNFQSFHGAGNMFMNRISWGMNFWPLKPCFGEASHSCYSCKLSPAELSAWLSVLFADLLPSRAWFGGSIPLMPLVRAFACGALSMTISSLRRPLALSCVVWGKHPTHAARVRICVGTTHHD